MNDYQVKARAILDKVIYATIATAEPDGTPWAAPQFVAYDQDAKRLYWCAARGSQHALNISHNPKAFIAIYDSSVGPGEGSGVYLRASAQEVVDSKVAEAAMAQLIQRHQGVPYWKLEDVQRPGSAVAVFAADIQRAWLNEGREENGGFVLYREPVRL
jgi:nitroimidazol reductase NimA-like FMN-containing flavoprotein (pyridoxamine 5'-phosphate oxidase superfamily)